MKVYKNFWDLLDKKNKKYFFLITCLIFLQAIVELFSIALTIPFVSIILNIIDIEKLNKILNLNFLREASKSTLLLYSSFLLIIIFALKNLVIVYSTKKIFQFVYDLRTFFFQNLLVKFLQQNYLFFVNKNFSKIKFLLSTEVENLVMNFCRPIIFLISELIILSLILILIIFYGFFDIFIILIPSIIFLSVILKYNNNNIKKWSNQRAELAEKQIGMSYRFVNGIKEVLLSGYIKDIVENFKKLMMSMAIIDTKINTVQAVPKGLLEFAAIFIFSLSLIYLNKMGYSSEETIVILSFYLAVAYRIIPSLNKIFVSYQQLKFGKPSYNLLQDYFNLKEENVFNEKNNPSVKNIFKKKIILKNINFDYFRSEKFFEKEIFEIEKFDKIGIYGDSGSGKSTLLNIITFLIKPKKIQLLIDGNEYSDKWKIRDYQNLFSYISQDTFLINDSIRQNILIGSNIDNLDNQKLNEAIKFAKLNNFINKTKNGIETNVGEGLKTISSGQRQRIAIARLYYNQKEILIFDEATNALDEKNEKEIIENIMNLSDKTIIIVSHNINNLKKCNKIYKIENRKIFRKK